MRADQYCSPDVCTAVLSPGEIAQIKAEIERLEQLSKKCVIAASRTRLGLDHHSEKEAEDRKKSEVM
jgi:hypothetical protein